MPFYPESELHNPLLVLEDEEKRPAVDALVQSFLLTPEQAHELKQVFSQEMERGLSADPAERKQTCLLMENTFMTRLPRGHEIGDFLSLDLGSTNFRVILSRLKGTGKPEDDEFKIKYYDVPNRLRVGESAKPLFQFLAQCISDFVSTVSDLAGKKLSLGFSFSYPMVQHSVDTGFLVTWTKSYDLTDAVGKDAVTFLRDALASQKDLDVDVVAILNDSTGTLVKGAYLDRDCVIGMIFGSGFNAAYMERVDRMPKLTEQNLEKLAGCSQVAVDIECGGFGDNGCIDRFKNEVDRELDKDSMFPHSFSFEKMLAGNFLGDVARRALVKLAEQGVLFAGVVTDQLKTKDSLAAADLGQIEKEGAEKVREVGRRIGYENLSEDDIRIIHYVGKIVAIRAAVLTSTLLSALIDRIDQPRNVIAIDGSLYSHHPCIHKLMMDVIRQLSPGKAFDIVNAKDGSGMGAGLAAAVLTLPDEK